MSCSSFGSYMQRKTAQQQNYCCVPGPQGPSGNGFSDISGVPPQIAFFQTPTAISGTPDAITDIATKQILFTDGTAAHPVIAFQGDADTGIYLPGTNAVGISAAGTLELAISANHVSAQEGAVGNPSYNFGLTGDTDTGMYRVGPDTIGFSTGGVQKVTITDTAGGGMINGINIGTTASIAGIRRLSATAANSWEDGHLGNSDAIFFTATDFVQGGNTTAGSDGTFATVIKVNSIDPGGSHRGCSRPL